MFSVYAPDPEFITPLVMYNPFKVTVLLYTKPADEQFTVTCPTDVICPLPYNDPAPVKIVLNLEIVVCPVYVPGHIMICTCFDIAPPEIGYSLAAVSCAA